MGWMKGCGVLKGQKVTEGLRIEEIRLPQSVVIRPQPDGKLKPPLYRDIFVTGCFRETRS